jgi:hypothetical protein
MWYVFGEGMAGLSNVGFPRNKLKLMVMNSFQSDGCFQLISISPLSFGNSWVFKALRCNFCVSFGILVYLRCAIILFSNRNNISKEKKNVAKYLLAASFFIRCLLGCWKDGF